MNSMESLKIKTQNKDRFNSIAASAKMISNDVDSTGPAEATKETKDTIGSI